MFAALPAPVVTRAPRAAAATSRGWIVTRSTCGSTWVGAGTGATFVPASQTAEPGNTDRTCPSGPTPSHTRSNDGQSVRAVAGTTPGDLVA